MAKIHGIPGEWARVHGTVLGMWPLYLALFAGGFGLALCLVSVGWGTAIVVAALVAGVCSATAGLRRIERFFIGARGEERVCQLLSALGEDYHVFNDFVAEKMHVDHVVAGPAGVFAVETKFWRGRVSIEDGCILVDGRLPSRPPLQQVLREAARVRRYLEKAGMACDVTPMLVFASDTFGAHVAEVNGVVVINSCDLCETFAKAGARTPAVELERIVALMENNE